MSLINQTLKELDKRRQESGAEDLSIHSTPGVAITATPPKSKSLKPLLLLLVVGVGGAAYWGMQQRKPTTPAPAIVGTPTPTVNTAVTNTASTNPGINSASPGPENKTESVATNPKTSIAETPPVKATVVTVTPPPSQQLPAAPQNTAINKSVTPAQQAENLYRQAITSLRNSQEELGRDQLRQALGLNPNHHDARQLLARALIDARQPAAARTLLQEGLALSPQRSGFYVAIAHSYIQFNEIDPALSTLQQGLAFAGNDAEYNALIAALYQRKSRHEDAARHYLVALRQSPDTANWLVGLGISLQATKNNTAAAEAFQRALDLGGLSPSLTATAQEQLKKITGKP